MGAGLLQSRISSSMKWTLQNLGPHLPWSARGDASLSLARQCWQWEGVTRAAHRATRTGGLASATG